jgi:hypothetical protein
MRTLVFNDLRHATTEKKSKSPSNHEISANVDSVGATANCTFAEGNRKPVQTTGDPLS